MTTKLPATEADSLKAPIVVGSGDLLGGPASTIKDFVVIVGNGTRTEPRRVRLSGDQYWLYYWHADKKWVTLCRIFQHEVDILFDAKLPADQAKLYEAGVPFLAA